MWRKRVKKGKRPYKSVITKRSEKAEMGIGHRNRWRESDWIMIS